MKIVKRILQGFGIIIGVIVFSLSIVTFVPAFKVPEQPLEQGKRLIKEIDTKPSWIRKDVSFKVKGTLLSAWLYLPENLSSPVPCIVMGHGFGGTKNMLLENYAIRYQKAGFATLIFDVTAAKDKNIACVSAQCPGLDGRVSSEMTVKRMGIGRFLKMVMHGQRDFFRSWFGLSPHKIPVVGKPGSIAGMNTQDAYDFFLKYAPRDYVNEVCARIILRGDKYRPVKYAKDVRCPVLLQICEYDNLIPKSAAEETENNWGNMQKLYTIQSVTLTSILGIISRRP